MTSSTTVVEFVQLWLTALASLASAVALVLYARTWHHIVLLDQPADRHLRIAAFAAVGREALRLGFCLALLTTAGISFWTLPAPPESMPWQDWLLVRKMALLVASGLLLLMVGWDFWLRNVLRHARRDAA